MKARLVKESLLNGEELKFSPHCNKDVIMSIQVGDFYLDPFHHTLDGNAIMEITEVEPLSTRFDRTNRLIKYNKYVPVDSNYDRFKFLEKSSLWAGDIKFEKIPERILQDTEFKK